MNKQTRNQRMNLGLQCPLQLITVTVLFDRSIPIQVSSTFETGISFFSFKSRSQCFFANCSSINAPWAPQSISTLVLMIFFPSIILMSTFINFESLSGTLQILRALMESPLKGLVVVASLCTKNPQVLLQLTHRHLNIL